MDNEKTFVVSRQRFFYTINCNEKENEKICSINFKILDNVEDTHYSGVVYLLNE
ncbi:hypothetical protein [Acetobacterium woodii]|uniref:hypothetical protein n=1 Tax=Acetobacterium woodii TaxID=33952 RepID=UPI0002F40536|nr:hypothetical protein [Acetobacterium woodii]